MIRALYILTLAIMVIVQILDIPDDDDDLIAQIVGCQVDGDRDETKRLVEVLYRRHSAAVSARLAGLAGSSNVDDLAQKTWVRIIEKLHTYKKGKFRAWAFTIAKHLWLDEVTAKRPRSLKAEAEVADGSSLREQESITQSERAQILRDCVSKLDQRHRDVIVGITYEQLEYKALCAKLGISANQAHKLKHEAKGLLADCCRRANR